MVGAEGMTSFKEFKPALLEFNSYLEHLTSPNARPEHIHAAGELALDLLDFCDLQEELEPDLWTTILQKIRVIMQGLIRALDGFLFYGGSTQSMMEQQQALAGFIYCHF